MSNNLGLTQVGATQNQKTVSINDQAGEIDAAITETATYTVDATDTRTLTNAEFRDVHFMTIDEAGADADITITVPAIKRGEFVLFNDTAFNVTVEIASQPVTSPVVIAGDIVIMTCDGTNVRIPGATAAVPASSLTLFKVPGIPFRGALAKRSSVQAISAATDTTLEFNTEAGGYDSEGFHDNSTNPGRMTIPPGVRRVRVTCGIKTSTPTSTDNMKLWIELNASAGHPGIASKDTESFNGSEGMLVTTGTIDVVAGDFFDAHVNFNVAGSITNDDATFLHIQVIEYNTVSPDLEFAGVAATRITSAQTIGTGDAVAVEWNGEDYDTDIFHDNSTNNSRLTVPANVTRVRMHASISMTTPGSGIIQAFITKNDSAPVTQGAASVIVTTSLSPATSESEGMQLMSGVVDVVAGDFFEVFIDSQVAGSLTNNVASHFTMEVVERSTTLVQAAVGDPFRGARVTKVASAQAISADTNTILTFDNEVYDTDNIHDAAANTKLTVPDGVTKVRLSGGIRHSTPDGTGEIIQLWIEVDGGDFASALVLVTHESFPGGESECLETPVISVTPGQDFELAVRMSDPGSILAQASSFFAMEIIESVEVNGGTVQPISFYFDGEPAASEDMWRMIVTDPFVLPDDLDGSQAHAGVVPSGVTVLDVLRNGVSIGGISFAVTTGIATFSTSGSGNEEFRVGDRLEIDAPGTINSLADLSVTLRAILMR